MLKEEDFVLSLYNRNLLTDCDVGEIYELLDKADLFIHSKDTKVSETLRMALATRIDLRRSILSAVAVDGILEKSRVEHWEACLKTLPQWKETHILGTPVENSFSVKIQRKLASTVPPRPIVDVTFANAFDFLSSLCQSGRDAYLSICFGGSTMMQVCLEMSSGDTRIYLIQYSIQYGHCNRGNHSHQHTYAPSSNL